MRLLLIFLVFIPICSWAQVVDSTEYSRFNSSSDSSIVINRARAAIAADTTQALKGKPLKRLSQKFFSDYPNPKKSLLVGLIIPGGGQMYNGSFWKLPLVYAAYGTVITIINDRTREFDFYQDQYFKFAQNTFNDELTEPFVLDEFIETNFSSPNQVKTIRDEFQRQKEYAWFALFGVTLLSVADAFVDCHLKEFDVSDDLTMGFKPTLLNTPGWGNAAGLGLSIPIR